MFEHVKGNTTVVFVSNLEEEVLCEKCFSNFWMMFTN
jgi:hypothetical protein